LRFHGTRPRAITPAIIVAIIALTIPATLAAVAPAEPATIESTTFSPVELASILPVAALPTSTAPASTPEFAPAVPAADLALEDVRVTAKKAAAAIRAATRPTPKAHAAAKITPPKPKVTPKPKPKAPSTRTSSSHVASSGSSRASGARARIVSIALAQRGDRYVSGGVGPNSFDCSGLVRYAYAQAGVSGRLGGGHSASAMLAWGRANGLTSRSGGRPGDVAIYGNGSHAAIYLGNGKIVSALNPSQGIRVTGLYALGSGFTAFIHTHI
jgi:cell wall-associated NlpC family hydrolase